MMQFQPNPGPRFPFTEGSSLIEKHYLQADKEGVIGRNLIRNNGRGLSFLTCTLNLLVFS